MKNHSRNTGTLVFFVKLILSAVFISSCDNGISQTDISDDGGPGTVTMGHEVSGGSEHSGQKGPEIIYSLPPLDNEAAQEQDDGQTSQANLSRIGIHREIGDVPSRYWILLTGPGDRETWKLVIESPGAYSIRPHFSRLPPEGYDLTLYGKNQTDDQYQLLDFAKISRLGMWGPVIPGPYLYIELTRQPDNNKPILIIDKISHVFRPENN